ncbi:hypothetical protein SAMN04489740_4340 [Arthrobacter alpinus]|uniref:Uncharacterized protein n=1 Tax=Arthrobacter alpinus TaxID=656366 RepID=A0A1H5PIY0_9MICC|nr:hypothetical protein [Arthrobacter alpinus]SEF13168.1 hypothetical protein SAMN04489740_4340 [Arthrobacter alpinus]
MREEPEAEPRTTSDFDNQDPDEMLKELHEYQLLGKCFETLNYYEMMGRGWLIEHPLTLVEGHSEKLRRAQRELDASVALARSQGTAWTDIAQALGVNVEEARNRFTATD